MKIAKWHQLVPFSAQHITQSSRQTHQPVMVDSWQSACPGEIEPFKDHSSTHGCLTSLRNKSQQKQPRQLLAPNNACLNC